MQYIVNVKLPYTIDIISSQIALMSRAQFATSTIF